MTGVMNGHDAPRRQGCRRFRWREPQDFGQVAHFGAESAGALGPGPVVIKEMAVFFQSRTATGGIDDDRLDVQLFEYLDIATRTLSRLFQLAAVAEKGTATHLSRRRNHVVSGAVEQADAGRIRRSKENAHNAAAHEPGS